MAEIKAMMINVYMSEAVVQGTWQNQRKGVTTYEALQTHTHTPMSKTYVNAAVARSVFLKL